MSKDKTTQAAERVKKWLDGGANSWGYPESQIRHLANVAPDLLDSLRAVLDYEAGRIPLTALVEIAVRNIAKAEGEQG